ncbi:uncharacterized protein O3C94_023527 [Discoglossus pictus]
MKGTAERLELYNRYISYYEDRSNEGNISLCNNRDVKGGSLLLSLDSPPAILGGFHIQVIKQNCLKRKRDHKTKELQSLVKGLEILELVCVHLFLYPWRKELRTLKKFTGNFVYFVQPVIPEYLLKQILQGVGYTEVMDTEYIITGAINTEEAKQASFELFLARIQCEEFIQLINDDRTDRIQIFLKGLSEEDSKEDIQTARQKTENNKESNFIVFNHVMDTNNMQITVNNPEEVHYKHPVVQPTTHDESSHLLTDYSLYHSSKHLDSEDFLTKYSDLNLAQKPIFPINPNRNIKAMTKGNRRNNYLVNQPISEDINTYSYTSMIPQRVAVDSKTNHKVSDEVESFKGRVFVQETVSDASADVDKYTNWQQTSENMERLVWNNGLNESAFNISSKNGHLERAVVKLKMSNEVLGFPIEETLPPQHMEAANNCEAKWEVNKSKELLYDSVTKPNTIDNVYKPELTYHTTIGVECGSDIESASHIREPPNSTYIPPGGAQRQCMRISDLQPEENHFQAPSLPTDMVMIDESLYNMNLDTREDFVIITKSNNLQR